MKRTYLLSANEMANCDKNTMEYYGIPSLVLMERAALSVFAYIKKNYANTIRVLVLTGTGNNGADGIAVARLLHLAHYHVAIYTTGSIEKATKQWKEQYNIYQKYDGKFVTEINEKYDVIVDGLFGIGLSRKISGSYHDVIKQINQSKSDIIAIDIPSGIDATTGNVLGISVQAKVTITFGFLKRGMILYPGRNCCGKIIIADIGIDENALLGILPECFTVKKEDIKLPIRISNGHKGSFGKLLIIAGSKQMAGAAILCAKAAFAMGIGMVKLVTHSSNRDVLLQLMPEIMLTCYDEESSEDAIDHILSQDFAWSDGLLIGPGIGQDTVASQLLSFACDNYASEKPMVIDADAINLLAQEHLYLEKLIRKKQNIIYTPHIKELSRLTGYSVSDIINEPVKSQRKIANSLKAVLISKDACTIVASYDADQIMLNQLGNNGMATAGSGDVLAGICAVLAIQCQMEEASLFEAAYLAVALHASMGDMAADSVGERSVTPSRMIEQLIDCIKNIDLNS